MFLKKRDIIHLNQIDQYLAQLEQRVAGERIGGANDLALVLAGGTGLALELVGEVRVDEKLVGNGEQSENHAPQHRRQQATFGAALAHRREPFRNKRVTMKMPMIIIGNIQDVPLRCERVLFVCVGVGAGAEVGAESVIGQEKVGRIGRG